jgi:hypothetical protein
MADMVAGLDALTGHGATTSHGIILKLKQYGVRGTDGLA